MLDDLIRRTLPFRVAQPLLFRRAQRYYQHVGMGQHAHRDSEVIDFLRSAGRHSTLLTGPAKSGNTWTRLVIYNYFRILHEGAIGSTLTFKEVNALQPNVLRNGPLSLPTEGYPLFVRAHEHYRPSFDHFDTVAYVYRHPLDTLVSLFYYNTRREVPSIPQGLSKRQQERYCTDIDAFAMHNAFDWALFHARTKHHAHVALCYERMKEDPNASFEPLIRHMTGTVHPTALARSIEISDIERVRERHQDVGDPKGYSDMGLKVSFTRSGRTGQYKQELKPSTIEQVLWFLDRVGITEFR